MSVTYRYDVFNTNRDVKYWRNRLFKMLKKNCPQFQIIFQSSWEENLSRLFVLMSHVFVNYSVFVVISRLTIILLVIMGDHAIVIQHAYRVIWKLVGATLQFKHLIHPEWDGPRQRWSQTLIYSCAYQRQLIVSLLSPLGNTPLHLAVMMGHKGESYLASHANVVYFNFCCSLIEFLWVCMPLLSFCVSVYGTFVTDNHKSPREEDAHEKELVVMDAGLVETEELNIVVSYI